MSAFSAYLQGAGLVTGLGSGLAAHAAAQREGRVAPFAVPQGFHIPPWPYCTVPGFDGPERMFGFLEAAVQQALDESGLSAEQVRRMALFVGSTCLDLPLHEDRYVEQAQRGGAGPLIAGPGYGNVAAHLAERFGIGGPQFTLNTACSSSANALLHARLLLAEGHLPHALVVGVEGYNRLSVLGFGSLLLLSKQGYRPFDRRRDGLILGEGAGAMVLSAAPPADAAGTVALCGAASACDPSSPTNSLPDRVADVMHEALYDAGLRLGDLVAIKAHGTGTVSNDLAEGRGLQGLPGPLPPVTSLKPYVGHTLGGCGVIESLMLVAAWRKGFLPGTPGFAEADPAIGVSPCTAPEPLPDRGAVLCNFFGFGGNNTSLVWSRP